MSISWDFDDVKQEFPWLSIIVEALANEIYFQRCMFFSVSKLPPDEERDCLIKAVRMLPAFLETYKKYADMRKEFTHHACYCCCEHMPEPCDETSQYLRRMHELGIEVDS